MKLNLKSTITAPAGQTLNGIVGNTRRGIRVDQTLDPDSNNPVANKPVSTALATLAGKIDAALQKPAGLTKTKLVGVGTSGQENIEIGDNLTLQDGKLSASGGGKSVPPTLLLFDPETEEVRTSITQEEKTNLDNGLYNQVVYFVNSPLDLANPGKLIFLGDQCLFSQFSFTGNIDTGYSVASLDTYQITVETKNASGEYPITINKQIESPLSGGGGNIVTIEVASMPDTQTTIDVSSITNDTQFVNIKETSTNKNYLLYRVGSDFASCFSNELTQGTIVAYYYIDTQQEQLYFFISSVGKMGKIFGNHDIQVPAVSSNNILPCTTADNGKVLSVVNGEAQWANAGGGSTKLYKHNIVLRENSNSEYLYIKHISSKQSKVASIADLNTLLGTDLYFFECSGEVKINGTWYNAVAIYWGGSYAKSRVVYNVPSEGEKTASLTIYTGIDDNVKPVE